MTIEPLNQPVSCAYEQCEWRLNSDHSFLNPFDPEEIAVDARFRHADGLALTIPAFWMADVDGEPGRFVVRFTPPLAGEWKFSVTANHRGSINESNTLDFKVARGNSHGFVRSAKENPRYFQYDDGSAFFAIGLNLCWGIDGSVESFDSMFAKLSAVGGNFARIWMCDPNFMTETAAAGLGRYDQTACAKYDAIFSAAERHGIACEVTFNHYRDLRESDGWGPCPWPKLPYAARNGGPCSKPAEFFALPTCQKLYRQRLRYIVGRYSAFTTVAFWELFNEQNFADVPIPQQWTLGMANYLRSIDPYARPISTSFGRDPQREVWSAGVIGFTQSHLYGGETTADCVAGIVSAVDEHQVFYKPHLVAELGISSAKPDDAFDPSGTAVNLHNGLWAAMLSGAAGGALNWWWDTYVAGQNLWHAYRGAAFFSRQIDWPRRMFARMLIRLGDPNLECLALLDVDAGEAIAWVHDRRSNWQSDEQKSIAPSPLHLSIGRPGLYAAQWWDTRSGRMMAEFDVSVVHDELELTTPTFVGDIAFRVIKRANL